MNAYEKNSGMKAPTTPTVEERIADSINVFFRPDNDVNDDDDNDDVDNGDGNDDVHDGDGDNDISPILSASHPHTKLPIICPTM